MISLTETESKEQWSKFELWKIKSKMAYKLLIKITWGWILKTFVTVRNPSQGQRSKDFRVGFLLEYYCIDRHYWIVYWWSVDIVEVAKFWAIDRLSIKVLNSKGSKESKVIKEHSVMCKWRGTNEFQTYQGAFTLLHPPPH